MGPGPSPGTGRSTDFPLAGGLGLRFGGCVIFFNIVGLPVFLGFCLFFIFTLLAFLGAFFSASLTGLLSNVRGARDVKAATARLFDCTGTAFSAAGAGGGEGASITTGRASGVGGGAGVWPPWAKVTGLT